MHIVDLYMHIIEMIAEKISSNLASYGFKDLVSLIKFIISVFFHLRPYLKINKKTLLLLIAIYIAVFIYVLLFPALTEIVYLCLTVLITIVAQETQKSLDKKNEEALSSLNEEIRELKQNYKDLSKKNKLLEKIAQEETT